MPNPEKTYARISAGIFILAIGFIFLPDWIGMDGLRGGYAVSFVAIFVAISAALVAWFFWQRAKTLDEIYAGKDLLAHWRYQPDEWQSYIDVERQEQTRQNTWLLVVMAVWAFFFGGLCWVTDREAGRLVFYIMLGLVLLLGMVAFGLPRLRYQRQRRGPGEAWITPKTIYIGGVLVRWDFWGTRLESVQWIAPQGNGLASLAFKVSFPSRAGRQTQMVRVPVPRGREAEARKIIEQIS
jgi:hypothetical protein